MARAKITITITTEYEIHPEYYPDCKTPEEMLALDVANSDPMVLLDSPSAVWDIKGEIVK